MVNWFFTKKRRRFSEDRTVSWTKSAGTTRYPYWKPGPSIHSPHHKQKLTQNGSLTSIKAQTIKFVKEYRENLCDHWWGKDLIEHLKHDWWKEKAVMWNSSKDSVKRTFSPPTARQSLQTTYLIKDLYTEHIKSSQNPTTRKPPNFKSSKSFSQKSI